MGLKEFHNVQIYLYPLFDHGYPKWDQKVQEKILEEISFNILKKPNGKLLLHTKPMQAFAVHFFLRSLSLN